MSALDSPSAPDSLRPNLQTLRSLLPWMAGVLTLIFLTVAIFWQHLTGKAFFTFDFPRGYYAMNAYWISSMQAGEWPHWIPYQSMGYPALMNAQLGMFYPPFWLFVALRLPYTMHAATVFQIAHILFGGIGMFLLAAKLFRSRSVALCGGIAFIFFGGFYSNSEHPDIVRTFAWVPWLFWGALIDNSKVRIRVTHLNWQTRISFRTLLLPILVACFIAGSYPGGMFAGIFLLFAFLAAQSILLLIESRDRKLLLDFVGQGLLVLLGVGMASVFLLPTFHLTRGITRAAGYGALPSWTLEWSDLLHLLFPSPLLVPWTRDYSMIGMQCPVVLLLFSGLLTLRTLRRIASFLIVGLIAALMCIAPLHPVAAIVIKLCPVLGLSRFPAGDYREFIYLAVLFIALAGLSEALRAGHNWRTISIMLVVLVCFELFSLHVAQQTKVESFHTLLQFSTMVCALGLLAIASVGLGIASRRFRITPHYLLPILICLSMFPVIGDMKRFWSDPEAIRNTYAGLPLKLQGKLRVQGLFNRKITSRPPRVVLPPPYRLSWRGYIDGSYMSGDLGNTESIERAIVESNLELASFMQKPSSVIGADCKSTSTLCRTSPDCLQIGVPITGKPSVGHATSYNRDSVEYDVRLVHPSLVIENEIYADGWHAECETHHKPLRCEEVDRALRGWVLPAGSHHVRVWYRTPLLFSGTVFTVTAMIIWIACLLAFCRLAKRTTPD
jgi:hypothetical protein